METAIEDAGLDRGPTLTSSWDAACGALTQSLLLTRTGPRAQDLDFEQLLEPPAPGQDLVSLKSSLSPRDENPCFIYLKCGPNGGEEILSVGVLSSARNMEVYLGEEYCGTSRGKNVCTVLDDSEHEKILLYKKYLKLESPTHACKIKNCLPIRDQLQSVLGSTGHKHLIALQSAPSSGVLDKAPSTPFPFRTGLTPSAVTENLKALIDKSTSGEGNTANHDECHLMPQNHSLESDLQNAVSSFLPKKASGNSNVPNSELLPFLQNLCSQVNHLRVGHNARWQENISKPREGIVGVSMEEQPVCSYLEKILSKNMELMEKKLMDHIDERIYQLQEHIDAKMALLVDLLRSPNSPPPGMPLRHYDSRERLSNGER
ncbi:uncharacterized protein C10orf88 homolog isoform X2 [Mastomys coucha]|uniref:uncharacterized protein C10orf88 homolog isoform X2 n=1 Tax=Mastomys coucha TaxID=35658 RepID=UPI001261BDD1|nr:uncharacterized protein C10orf88 homolog isoform X2 [Mastomys coucha]